MTAWAVAGVAAKFCIYLASAAGIGGGFTLVLIGSRCHPASKARIAGTCGVLAACALGILASLGYFFCRVGDFADSGLAGVVDPLFIQILWESPVGQSLLFRLAGFILLLLAIAGYTGYRGWPRPWSYAPIALLYVCGAAVTAYAFSFTGHSSELGIAGRFAITAHVLAALWWAGALYPLWRATHQLEITPLQAVLHRFGAIAGVFVLLVAIAGAVLLALMLQSRPGDLSFDYAIGFAVKLALVAGLLLIAAHHKWRAVPRLAHPGGVAAFRRSLQVEGMVAVAILAMTAILSTALGPFHGA